MAEKEKPEHAGVIFGLTKEQAAKLYTTAEKLGLGNSQGATAVSLVFGNIAAAIEQGDVGAIDAYEWFVDMTQACRFRFRSLIGKEGSNA